MRKKEETIVVDTPVARLLTKAINASSKSQTQLCGEVGLRKSNIISMFKQGRSPFPMTRAAAFSNALDIAEEELMIAALQSTYPEEWRELASIIASAVEQGLAN